MKAINLSTASVALAALLFADAAEAAVQAGVSAAVRGKVDVTPVVEQVVRPIGSDEDVFLGDGLKSHEQSGMQLMLLDETSITLGPNADLTVDEFVYDPATGIGEVTASLATGVFRFVTGKTSQGSDKAMTLKVPFGVIGVRGTIGAVRNDAAGSLIVLLGPGSKNNADEPSGALDVTAQGKTVSLTRPGFGTIIAAGQPPMPAFEVSDEQVASILEALVAPLPTLPPELAPSVQTAVRTAKQDIAAAKETSGSTGDANEQLDDLEDPINPSEIVCSFCGQVPPPLPSIGNASFSDSGVPLTDGGTYNFNFNVTFDPINPNISGAFQVQNTPTLGGGSPATSPNFNFNQDFDPSAVPAFQFLGADPDYDLDFNVLLASSSSAANSVFIINNATGQTTTVSHPVPWTQVCLMRRA